MKHLTWYAVSHLCSSQALTTVFLTMYRGFCIIHFALWIVTSCGLLSRHKRFGETYCLHLQEFTRRYNSDHHRYLHRHDHFRSRTASSLFNSFTATCLYTQYMNTKSTAVIKIAKNIFKSKRTWYWCGKLRKRVAVHLTNTHVAVQHMDIKCT
jgi:hypothetical protein